VALPLRTRDAQTHKEITQSRRGGGATLPASPRRIFFSMHNQTAMLEDLREAIRDMPESATVIHFGGVRSTISECAFSDVSQSNRMIEDEGIMIEADTEITFASADATKAIKAGDKVLRGNVTYRVLSGRTSRGGVSITLPLKEI